MSVITKAVIALLCVNVACSSSAPVVRKKPAPKPQPVASPTPAPADDEMQVSGLMGTLAQSDIDNAMHPAVKRASRCFAAQTRAEPYLGGQLTLKFRVAVDGTSRRVVITASSVGSVTVEQDCVLKHARKVRFPRPSGNAEAEFTYSLTFPQRMALQQWAPEVEQEACAAAKGEQLKKKKMKKRRRKKRRRSTRRRARPPKGLVVTLYVDRRGGIASYGMAAEEDATEDFATMMALQLKAVKLPKPVTGTYAKVACTW